MDKALALIYKEFSRSRIKCWIDEGLVLVDEKKLRPKDLLQGGEIIRIKQQHTEAKDLPWQAEPMTLNILYEDEDVIIINKQSGLVVHPAAGNWSGTLVNGLLAYDSALQKLPRAGVVHRLDKDTTGLMVVARNLKAHTSLIRQLEKRKVTREYKAVVAGVLTGGGCIDKPIGRHKTKRTKMAVISNGKEAVTHYRVIEKYRAHTLVKVILDTGRTHQIRVHMADNKMPLVGDKTYGGRLRLPRDSSQEFIKELKAFPRQALHAFQLGFEHPASYEFMKWQAEMPQDMLDLIKALKQDVKDHA